MDKYMGALFLPHTNAHLFPTVCKYLDAKCQMIQSERKVS
jgi:hypothetical protein